MNNVLSTGLRTVKTSVVTNGLKKKNTAFHAVSDTEGLYFPQFILSVTQKCQIYH